MASNGLSTIAKELCVEADNLLSIRVIGGKNIVEVVCKDQATRDRAMEAKEIKIGEKKAEMKKVENWTGIVIGGIEVKWGESEGKMEELAKILEEENNVAFTKCPRWLVRKENQVKGSTHQSIVVHVARAQDRQNLVEKGANFLGDRKFTRLFESARDKARKQCTKCCAYGHMWYECRGKEKCGKCGKNGHTAWTHRCKEKTCSGSRQRNDACRHYTPQCAVCGGDHHALRSGPSCRKRKEAYTFKEGNPLSGCPK